MTTPTLLPENSWDDLKVMVIGMARHLVDAMVMFENIDTNRNMPPAAYTSAQYKSKGQEIRAFLREHGLIERN